MIVKLKFNPNIIELVYIHGNIPNADFFGDANAFGEWYWAAVDFPN